MRHLSTSLDGTQVAYEIHGAGSPAFVLVHGWSCNRSYWDAQVLTLATSSAVMALDLAGHGESGRERIDWTIAAFGADVVAVVDEAALDDVVLVGHSMGADVILEAARQLRGRVRGLVWVDQYSQLKDFMSVETVSKRVAPFRAQFAETTDAFVRRLFLPSSPPALVERVCAEMSSAPHHIALAALAATWNHAREVPEILSELKLPVVAINAERPSSDLKSMNDLGVQVIVMPEVGHFPMMERPDEFNTCLARAASLLGAH
jgi:pimeloyl-ACP methyl ester carboxylesterase